MKNTLTTNLMMNHYQFNYTKKSTSIALPGWILLAVALAFCAIDSYSQTTPSQTYNSTTTHVVPFGVKKLTAQVWGGGAAGAGSTGDTGGGSGGGGGGYTKAVIDVTGGTVYNVEVGSGAGGGTGAGGAGGQSYFGTNTLVQANGGSGGAIAGGNGGNGGTTGTSSGTSVVTHVGGKGGRGQNPGGTADGKGAPGGSSAGTAATGTDGPDPFTAQNAAAAPSGGGQGGDGGNHDAGGGSGSAPGGGGGGSGDNDGSGTENGGAGADGRVTLTWVGPFQVGTVTPTGGVASAGAWFPSVNTGISIVVPIANDNALNTGTVQIIGSTGGAFTNIGTAQTISAINGNKTINLTKAEFEALSGFGTGKNIQISAIITSATGNQTQGLPSTTGTIVMPAGMTGQAFLTTVAASSSYTVPTGVYQITAEAWGAGGGGGSSNDTQNSGGSGGGGGGYSRSVITNIAPGAQPGITVGAGGNGATGGNTNPATVGTLSQFPTTTPQVIANGGGLGGNDSGTVGAGATAGTGTAVANAGGAGGDGGTGGGAGGGSSAGSGGAGTVGGSGDGAAGGVAPTGGGNGGLGGLGNTGGFGFPGNHPGGGGGGSDDNNNGSDDGGAGGEGLVILSYALPPTIVSIVNNVGTISTSAPTQTVVVTFSEAMNTSINTPVVTISGANWGAQTGNVWSLGNTVLTITRTHTLASELTTANTTVTLGATGTRPRSAQGVELAASITSSNFNIDTQVPVFTVTQPVNSTTVNSATVSYSLNEAVVVGANSKITYTGTAGPDNGNTHTHLLTAGEVTAAPHNSLLLADINAVLVNGSTYTVAFDGVDAGGNPAAQVTRTGILVDNAPPAVFTVGSVLTTGGNPVAGYWNGTNTGVDIQVPVDIGTLDPTVVGGTIQLRARVLPAGVFANIGTSHTIIGGDRNTNVAMPTLSAANITAIAGYAQGVSLEFTATMTDGLGNLTTGTASATTLFVDTVVPVISATSPANSANVSTSNVSYTLSEAVAAGANTKIVWTQTGGVPVDGASPHTYLLTGGELATGVHTNITLASVILVDAVIYSVAYDVRDVAGNTAVQVQNTNVAFDGTPPAAFAVGSVTTTTGTIVAGFWNSTNTGPGAVEVQVPVDIGTLDPTVVGGTIQLQARILPAGVFANIGASHAIIGGDRNTTVVMTLSDANITAIAGYAQDLSLEFTAVITDIGGNQTAGTASATTLFVDTVVPVISATSPASSVSVSTSNVSYTLSEAVAAGANTKIVWTQTGGVPVDGASPHTYLLTGAELATGAHTNITLASVILVEGAIYSVDFDVKDAAGNVAVQVQTTNVTFDATPPAAFTVGSVVTTGGTSVAGFWNTTNTGVDVQVPVDIGTLDPTIVGGSIQLQARETGGSFANIGALHIITAPERNTNVTLSLTGGNITSITGYADGVTLEFQAIIKDAAGLPTTGSPSVTTLLVDITLPVISSTAPVNSAFVNTSNVAYTLSENIAAVAGSRIRWNRTGGTVDGTSPHDYFLSGSDLSAGAHAINNIASLTNASVYDLIFDAVDVAGNPAATVTRTLVTYDITPPTVSSIDINPATVLTGFGTTNGTTANPVSWIVTFNEDVSNVDLGDFSLAPSNVSLIASLAGISGGPKIYTVSANIISGNAQLRLDYIANGTVKDLANNTGVSSFTTGQFFSITLPEPTAQVTALSVIPLVGNNSAMTVSFTPAAPQPSRYHLRFTGQLDDDSNGTPIVVADGFLNPNDFGLAAMADGAGLYNGLGGASTGVSIGGFLSGKTYTVEVISANLSPNLTSDNVDYLMTGIPSTTVQITTGSLGILSAGTSTPPTTISSLQTASFGPDINFAFKIQDDGASPGTDNSRTRFDQIIFTAGAGNTGVATWQNLFAQAELTDITNNPGSPILTTNIVGNTIIFSSIPVGAGAVGSVADNQTKEYTLRVRLKNPLGTVAAKTGIDNEQLVFQLLEGNVIYYTATSQPSRLVPGQSVTGPGGANIIDVDATNVTFSPTNGGTQPPSTAFVLGPLSITPVARATDVNGVTDHDYVLALAVSTATGIITNPTSITSTGPGVYTFPAGFNYTDDGPGTANNGTITLTNGGVTGTSTNVTVSYSNTTTILAGANPEPANLSSLQTGGYSIPASRVFDFTISDDNGAGGDGAPTVITGITITEASGDEITDWTELFFSAALYDNAFLSSNATITPTSMIFTISPANLGLTADNASHTYQLLIRLKPALGGVLPSTIDGLNVHFQVQKADIVLDPASSIIANGETEDSGSGNNNITVAATRLTFTSPTPPNPMTSPLLLDKDLSVQQTVPVVEALDVNGNRDLDYSPSNIVLTDNAAPARTFTNPPGASSMVSGLLTFPNNFRYTSTGTGTMTVSSSPVATSAVSNAFVVRGASSTTITAGAAAPATITSLTNISPGVAVFNFNVNDDAGAENDGTPTRITDIFITQSGSNTVANWSQIIAGAQLTDGTTTVPATSISATSIAFNGIPTGTLGLVADGATKNYSLQIWLKISLGVSAVDIDGKAFGFEVLAPAPGPSGVKTLTVPPYPAAGLETGSTIIPGENENSGSNNVITVLASTLRFLYPAPPTASVNPSLSFDYPGIQVEAVDANGNRDVDFTGANSTVRALTRGIATPISTGMINKPVTGTTQFTAGLLSFASNFQFTTGSNGDDVTLQIAAGLNSTCGSNYSTGGICATSGAMTLQSSSESVLMADPTFAYTPGGTIDYVNRQATDITNSSTSIEIARLLLIDGSKDNFIYGPAVITTNTNNDGALNLNKDIDGANTILNTLQLLVTNPSNIRRIALYDGSGNEIAGTEQGNADLVGAGPRTFTFNTGSPLLTAIDNDVSGNGIAVLSVRVSFWNDNTKVRDRDAINVSVVDAQTTGGSIFFNTPPYIGGINGGYQSLIGNNIVNVVATKIDFTSLPGPFAGFNDPFNAGVVEARDQFSVRDTDFNGPAAISSAVATSGTFTFFSGVANLNGLLYNNTGLGTLTVTSGAINSNVDCPGCTPPNQAIKCPRIDVIHVSTTLATGGVISTTNLAGGSTGKVIFGVTFNPLNNYTVPGHPKLNQFTITFSNPVTGVFNNMKVFEVKTNVYTPGGAVDVTTFGGTLTPLTSSLIVSFPGGRDLSSAVINPNNQLTYFLMVDVDVSASGNTPAIQPTVIDQGSGATNGNIATSAGSARSNLTSPAPTTYTFASIFPPILTSSNPAKGQLNVDPAHSSLDLFFSVPVWSLDQVVSLCDQSLPGSPCITLNATNGVYAPPALTGLSQPLSFAIPPSYLTADHVYYVTIAQGNQAGNDGIMDENANVFGGISYPGTLYFKVATTAPPKLLGIGTTPSVASNPSISFTNTTSAVINATFDQRGTAFYLVLNAGSTAPTKAEIDGSSPYIGFIARGNFQIQQTIPQSAYGVVIPNSGTPFVPGLTYDVWMYSQNEALPTPFATSGPYGGAPSFTPGGAGPTFISGTVPSNSTSVTFNNPDIFICNNSFQTLTAPIIITEGERNQFYTNGGPQSLNLVLPAGFQFDVSAAAAATRKIELFGTDFPGGLNSGVLSFLGNSILQVTFDNTGNSLVTSSFDMIIITGLRVIAPTSASGGMFRLGGQAIPSIPDLQDLAGLTSFDPPVISFTNSYSQTLVPAPASVVTSIPDNAVPSTIVLSPIPASGTQTLFQLGDYGPSSFTGQGVNIDKLTLSAVTLDVPFNITVTHTDNNGCISQNAIQYTVYNHNVAINITDGILPGGNTIVTTPLNSYCADNDKFVVGQVNAPTPNRPFHVRFMHYLNLAPFFQIDVKADFPAGGGPQLISGLAWRDVINNDLLVVSGSVTTPSGTFLSYTFDDAVISGANNYNAGVPDPYSYFRATVTSIATGTPRTITYYTGGSLGLVEFTGNFQSRTNSAVKVPRVQRVEFFLPAVPIVDVSQASFVDTADPKNQPYSVSATGPVHNPGTLVYCEAGGPINITARPAAVPGQSVGTFVIEDITNPSTPVPIVSAGFIDNSNGTATLDPSVASARNLYADIKITYTYKDNNSPCSSSSYQIIRITPNPVAGFVKNAVSSVYTPTPTSFCVGHQIDFDAKTGITKTTIAPAPAGTPANTIQNYKWNFGDVNSATNDVLGDAITGFAQSHTFGLAQTYIVSLDAVSNWGCPAVTYQNNTKVGGIPAVKIKFDGVAVGDTFNFIDNGSTVSSNDTFASFDWDLDGDGTVFEAPGATVTKQYLTPGPLQFDMKVTSGQGCVNKLSLQPIPDPNDASQVFTNYRSLVVLDRVVLPVGAVYSENFNTSNGKWQVWGTGKTVPEIYVNNLTKTWAHGALPAGVAPTDPNRAVIAGSGVWKTNLGGNYNAGEKSGLHSPAIDIRNLTRAMISFNSVVQTEKSDGVVMEYSVDNLNIADPNKVWLTLGSIGNGEDWLTDQGIAGRPGTQLAFDFGWSGSDNPNWTAPKHILDEVMTGATPPAKAVFRVALGGAAPTVTKQGYTFDNVRIGDRTRTILLESFANTSNTAPSDQAGITLERQQNDFIAAYNSTSIGTEVVKVNYHVAFPGRDPFNEDNPADPSARALFYNVTRTPTSRLDGEKDALDRNAKDWVDDLYNLRTLQLAQADIQINVSSMPSGKLSVTGSITSTVLTGIPGNIILHVAVLEQSVPMSALPQVKAAFIKSGESNFNYTLKKLLPSAGGTRLNTLPNFLTLFPGGSLPFGQTLPIGPFEWAPDPKILYPNPGDIAVAIFLQQENFPFEVFQVELIRNIADPPTVTGLEPIPADHIAVYPNPAHKEMTIELPGVLASPAGLLLFDQMGKSAMNTTIPAGHSKKTLNVEDLAAGLYILQIETGPGAITRKKVVVVHE